MKQRVLDDARHKRRQLKKDANNYLEEVQDFASIEQDMSDVAVLYQLTVQLLLPTNNVVTMYRAGISQLSQLGFTTDEKGICLVLALLKAYSISMSDGTEPCTFAIKRVGRMLYDMVACRTNKLTISSSFIAMWAYNIRWQ
jgi:hypothetical protein